MSDHEAVVPRQFILNFKKLKEEQEGTHEQLLKDDEQIWASFYDTPAYRAVKKYSESLIDALDQLEGQAFEAGADLSEIGLRRAVNRLTKSNVMSLIKKVEQTAQIVHEQRKKHSG